LNRQGRQARQEDQGTPMEQIVHDLILLIARSTRMADDIQSGISIGAAGELSHPKALFQNGSLGG
jgi:hypothetical protein